MIALETLCEDIRSMQRRKQAETDAHTAIGTPLEIDWEGHLPVRVLVNTPTNRPHGQLPCFINAHGGGFIEGDALNMGTYCQLLADRLGIVVFNINYRLSPDHVYPYQADEVRVLRRYIQEHQQELGVDDTRCGIGGFSAGASLAQTCVVRAIESGEEPYRCCVLGYPMTTAAPGGIDPNAPYQPGDETMMRAMEVFFHGMEETAACSPLLADEALLRQFPATILFTSGKDALAEQGRAFAAKLIHCGIRVSFEEFHEACHGFLEVNREDYFWDDPRKTPEQLSLTKKAEELILNGLSAMLL